MYHISQAIFTETKGKALEEKNFGAAGIPRSTMTMRDMGYLGRAYKAASCRGDSCPLVRHGLLRP